MCINCNAFAIVDETIRFCERSEAIYGFNYNNNQPSISIHSIAQLDSLRLQ